MKFFCFVLSFLNVLAVSCGGYVPRRLPKVGSREQVFLEKMRGLGSQNWEILHLES